MGESHPSESPLVVFALAPTGGVVVLHWSLANPYGIQRDEGRAWHAGHINDVVELGGESVLIASDGGGVWQLGSSVGLPLSLDWTSGDTRALAALPGRGWYLAGGSDAVGGGLVYTTDPGAPIPLWTWVPAAVPAEMGVVVSILVVGNHVVLATVPPWRGGGGLWTSRIPDAADPTAYAWQLAAGLNPLASVTGIAPGPDETVIVGADAFLYFGEWRGDDLVVSQADVPGAFPGLFPYVIVGSSPSDPSVAYACSIGDPPGPGLPSPTALLATSSGGQMWQGVGAADRSTGQMITEHSQYGYTGAIAVSPHDPRVIVLGYTQGPWVSVDGGMTFFPPQRLSHDDKHRYRFNASGRLYEASDGGVFITDDLAPLRSGAAASGLRGMDSHLNHHLANLQFLGPSSNARFWGRTNASRTIPGLIGGGLQDNNDVYCLRWPGGGVTPWQALPPDWGYDGQAIFFLADGTPVFTYGDSREASWNPTPPQLVAEDAPIQVRSGLPNINYDGGALPAGASGTMAIVSAPEWANADGEMLHAVCSAGLYAPPAGSPRGTPGPPYSPDIYGLFSAPGEVKRWDLLVTLPLPPDSVVSAIASATGRKIVVGTREMAQIWVIDCEAGFALTQAQGLPPNPPEWSDFILDVAIEQDAPNLKAYALYNAVDYATGLVSGALYHTPDGSRWSELATRGLPPEPFYCLLRTAEPESMLCAATDRNVYVSPDGGQTWTNESGGLPARPHCSDLFDVVMPDGRHLIYMSTYGWSVWAAELPARKRFRRDQTLFHYPFLYPDDPPLPENRYGRLNDMPRPPLNRPDQPTRPASGMERAWHALRKRRATSPKGDNGNPTPA